ncbi:recombinase family protein [Duganella dendranthematis]|uniref:Recombinase family protein n=1 Tax=Duganella dendranthematis TaxID=2728021 RepID=A0ABX6M6H1_9BURK|nr:recombinase family protein [Duganella dendranthematis]QJD89903.1 recombinase family protein [Duganella dendranthematis]
MSKGQTVGYVRVSSVGQNTVRQLDGVTLDKVFTDKCSGGDTNRPALQAMLSHVREGDTVVVHEISRLARNTADLLALVQQLTDKGVTIKFSKEQLTFTGDKENPMNKMLLTMLGAVSAFELAMINERRVEGQAKARAAGKHMGRTAKLDKATQEKVRKEAAMSGVNKAKLAKDNGISRATLYAILKAA